MLLKLQSHDPDLNTLEKEIYEIRRRLNDFTNLLENIMG
jgi:hypothetical protein